MAIMTESSMKDYYRNQRTGALNTYDPLFGTVNMQEKAALGSLKYDYGKALNEAYIASQNQANAIMASNLGTGYKERELDKLEPTLQQAYEKYAQSYQQGIDDVEQNANTARTQISEQLSNQAAMATNLTNSTADYLRYLWESTKDNPNSVFYTDPKFQRYTKLNAEEQAKYDAFARDNVLGSKVAKEIGSQYNADVRELMADEDLMNLLYDENGLMTIAGTEFYDILLNADKSLFGDDVLSYNTWLYNQQQAADEKSNYYGLYDWYNAYNPYASNLDEYGLPTNNAYLRTAFGLASSDNAYRFAERWGGFTEEELDSYRYYHEYWTKRGITDEDIIELFDLGYDKRTNCITFPVRDIDGNCLFVARRNVETKWFNYPKDVDKPLYGLYEMKLNNVRCGKNTKLYITESMIDCILLWQAGYYAVALNGTGSAEQIETLRKLPIRHYVLATDNDNAGLLARNKIRNQLSNKLITEIQFPDDIKDIGECTKEQILKIERWEVF